MHPPSRSDSVHICPAILESPCTEHPPPREVVLLSQPLFCDSRLRMFMKSLQNEMYLPCCSKARISSGNTCMFEDESCLCQDDRCEFHEHLILSSGIAYIFELASHWHRHHRCSRHYAFLRGYIFLTHVGIAISTAHCYKHLFEVNNFHKVL